MNFLGWTFGEACFTSLLVGVGTGLLIPDHNLGTSLGMWSLALALRMIVRRETPE